MRKTLIALVFAVVPLLSLGIASCRYTPLEPDAGVSVKANAARVLSATIVQSVTGSAHLVNAPRDRTTTISIHRRADGAVEGWVHTVARRKGGAKIRIRIECLRIVGNQAWASGVVVDAASADNIGRPYAYKFVDNGQGPSAAPDEYGAARFQDLDCMTEPDISTRPILIGNIQIRD